MQNVFKIISLLLDYPDAELHQAIPEIVPEMTADGSLNERELEALKQFVNYIAPKSLAEWQMDYVQFFDYSQRTNLYLFDHVYGNSRERGQAMVDLREMYSKSGYDPNTNELPDFLPVFLEYLSLLEEPAASGKLLTEVSHILDNMRKSLKKKETPYFHLLDILCSISDSIKSEIIETKEVEV